MDKWREALKIIAERTLSELAPEKCLLRTVRIQNGKIFAGLYRYDLRRFRRVIVVGFGKASARMASALENLLGNRISEGFAVTAEGCAVPTKIIEVAEAGHPVPDERTLQAGQRILNLVKSASEEDLVIVLISGGGSALFEIPLPGLSLADLAQTTSLLLRAGATIQEMNAVRKHLSSVKGGRLAQIAQAAKILALVLSDVPGDDFATIASGPTAPDPTSFAQAVRVLETKGIWNAVPKAVREHLLAGAAGKIPETPKPGDPCFRRVRHVLIGSGRTALTLAQNTGRNLGFRSLVLTSTLRGEAREVAKFFAALAEEERRFKKPVPPPALLLAAGETTVTVRGEGRGGRNQELALSFALEIQGLSGVALLALATDGRDGLTDAAGAIVDGETVDRIKAADVDPLKALAQNDSYTALSAARDLLLTGPTGTNVADLVILAVERRSGV